MLMLHMPKHLDLDIMIRDSLIGNSVPAARVTAATTVTI